MATGHEQTLKMMGAGQPKVNKAIRPPVGYGPIDKLFEMFNNRWRDEWKRKFPNQEACNSLAREWQVSLRWFDKEVILEAGAIAVKNCVAPPDLLLFSDMVKQVKKDRKPPTVTREFGREALKRIKDGDFSLAKQ